MLKPCFLLCFTENCCIIIFLKDNLSTAVIQQSKERFYVFSRQDSKRSDSSSY